MKPPTVLLALLGVILGVDGKGSTPEGLDPKVPIYMGDVFWPPSMTFIAWLPSEPKEPAPEVHIPGLTKERECKEKKVVENSMLDWCYNAVNIGQGHFSLKGVNFLKMHDFFEKQAYITREGKRFADCFVTPECTRVGVCEGVITHDCEGGHKFTGPGTRRWVCWIIEGDKKNSTFSKGPLRQAGERLTDAIYTRTADVTGAVDSGSLYGATIPGPTASL